MVVQEAACHQNENVDHLLIGHAGVPTPFEANRYGRAGWQPWDVECIYSRPRVKTSQHLLASLAGALTSGGGPRQGRLSLTAEQTVVFNHRMDPKPSGNQANGPKELPIGSIPLGPLVNSALAKAHILTSLIWGGHRAAITRNAFLLITGLIRQSA